VGLAAPGVCDHPLHPATTDIYWIYMILFLGPLGALIYIFVEAVPDIGLLRQSFKAFPRRKRISELETIVRDNPSSGNYEELGDLYMSRVRQSYCCPR
jgi:hypothetical protein